MESFTIELISNASAQLVPGITLGSLTNIIAEATESARSMGGCNFAKIITIKVPKCYRDSSHVFWRETFKVVRNLLSGTSFLPFYYGYFWSYGHSHSKKTRSERKLYYSWSVTKNSKSWSLPCKSRLPFFIRDLGHILGTNLCKEFGVMLRGKGTRKPDFAYLIVRIHSLIIYTDLIKYNIFSDMKAPLLRCYLFPPNSRLETL